MGWKESEVRLLLLFCLFEKGLSGRVPGGEGHRRTRGEAQLDPIPNLTSPKPIPSSPNPNPSRSHTSRLSRPNAIPPLGSHKEESGEAVTIGVQVVKVPSLKFHEKVRSFENIVYNENAGENLPRCVGQDNQETLSAKGGSTPPTINQKGRCIKKSWLETQEGWSAYQADEKEEPEDEQ